MCPLWKVFENGELREKIGSKRKEVAGGWRKRIMRNFITCTLLKILL
jgi:hypothetical protein